MDCMIICPWSSKILLMVCLEQWLYLTITLNYQVGLCSRSVSKAS